MAQQELPTSESSRQESDEKDRHTKSLETELDAMKFYIKCLGGALTLLIIMQFM